jgi:hypothetical protein
LVSGLWNKSNMPIESQLLDTEVRRQIGERLDSGLLPRMLPEKIFAGYGSGSLCAACSQPITATQVQYDIEHSGGTLSLHFACHMIWQIECQLRIKAQRLQQR